MRSTAARAEFKESMANWNGIGASWPGNVLHYFPNVSSANIDSIEMYVPASSFFRLFPAGFFWVAQEAGRFLGFLPAKSKGIPSSSTPPLPHLHHYHHHPYHQGVHDPHHFHQGLPHSQISFFWTPYRIWGSV